MRPRCEICGLDYGFADAGDGPAVFVILFAGFVVVFSRVAGGSALPAAVLAARAVVGAAHSAHHACAVAADEGRDDRAAVSPQGRRGPFRPRSSVNAQRTASRSAGAGSCCARRICGPDRARHLADRAQGVEGRADRNRCGSGLSAAPTELPPRSAGRTLNIRRIPNSCASNCASIFATTRRCARLHRGSALRDDITITGLLGFHSRRLCRDRQRIVVNRGFVPGRSGTIRAARPGPSEIVGDVRWPEQRRHIHTDHDPPRNSGTCAIIL